MLLKLKPLVFLSVILFVGVILSGCTKKSDSDNYLNLDQPTSSSSVIPLDSDSTPSSSPSNDQVVAINTTKGQMLVKLYAPQAPNTVANFLKKSASGFYKNLTFHRVEPGFVIQGGDPRGDGTGGGIITSEINSIPFKKGSLGLARGSVKSQSNDSQFFICLTDEACQHLTNEYVNFGEVVNGFNVATGIEVGDKILEITADTK